MNNSTYFNKALHDMVFENACGAAIKRLADKSFPISYIHKVLDYPVSFERVQRYVWQYYLDNKTLIYPEDEKDLDYKTECIDGKNIIIIKEPAIKKTFVKEQGLYGKTTFRQVIINENNDLNIQTNNISERKYIACDFGIIKENNPAEYKKILDKLDREDRLYVSDMSWENRRVYHITNEKINSIIKSLNKQ